jgi:hypothetical protein
MSKKPIGKIGKLYAKGTARLLEETAYNIDSFKLPIGRSKQTNLTVKMLKTAKTARKLAGQEPKTYFLQRPNKNLEI